MKTSKLVMKSIASIVGTVALCASPVWASPDIIINPTAATSNDVGYGANQGAYGAYPAANTIDGFDLATTYTTGETIPVTWSVQSANSNPEYETGPGTSNTDTTDEITWNLGADYNLTGFHMWNIEDINIRGLQFADVLTSTDGTHFTDQGVMDFTEATPDGGTSDTGADYVLPVTAQYVEFTDFVSRDGTSTASTFSGVSAIVFEGSEVSVPSVPEPSTYALMGLGALALLVINRRRLALK